MQSTRCTKTPQLFLLLTEMLFKSPQYHPISLETIAAKGVVHLHIHLVLHPTYSSLFSQSEHLLKTLLSVGTHFSDGLDNQ